MGMNSIRNKDFYELHYGDTSFNDRTQKIFDITLEVKPKKLLDIWMW